MNYLESDYLTEVVGKAIYFVGAEHLNLTSDFLKIATEIIFCNYQ